MNPSIIFRMLYDEGNVISCISDEEKLYCCKLAMRKYSRGKLLLVEPSPDIGVIVPAGLRTNRWLLITSEPRNTLFNREFLHRWHMFYRERNSL